VMSDKRQGTSQFPFFLALALALSLSYPYSYPYSYSYPFPYASCPFLSSEVRGNQV